MATPTLTASLNKATYAPGESMLLTVNYADADNQVAGITVTGTDLEGNAAQVVVSYTVADAVALSLSDSLGKTFVKQSDNGAVAVYKATA